MIHIIPAAGKASRIGGIPKFLLPIGEKKLDYNADLLKVNTKTMNETVLKVLEKYPNENDFLLTMPDTYFFDLNLINKMFQLFNEDVSGTLGLWNIKENQIGKLGQCKIDQHYVTDIQDKNINCNYKLFWGAIMWKRKINKYIMKKQQNIGFMVENAIKNRHKFNYSIAKKDYYDCGTFLTYKSLITR